MLTKPLKYGKIVQTYSINEFGKVINTKRNKEVVPHIDKDGYLNISLSTLKDDGTAFTKRYRLHILVMVIFNSKKKNKDDTVNHIDTNKSNNHYKNLEWMTGVENYLHACANNLNPKGFNHGRAGIDEDTLTDICNSLINGESQSSIAKRLNVIPSKISKIRNKENWSEFSDKFFTLKNGKIQSLL